MLKRSTARLDGKQKAFKNYSCYCLCLSFSRYFVLFPFLLPQTVFSAYSWFLILRHVGSHMTLAPVCLSIKWPQSSTPSHIYTIVSFFFFTFLKDNLTDSALPADRFSVDQVSYIRRGAQMFQKLYVRQVKWERKVWHTWQNVSTLHPQCSSISSLSGLLEEIWKEFYVKSDLRSATYFH